MKNNLSPREKEVLNLIISEYTTNEIARKLFVSSETVKSHRKNLLTKLKARNVAGLVVRALQMEMFPMFDIRQQHQL